MTILMSVLRHIAVAYVVLYLGLVAALHILTPVVVMPSGRRVRVRFRSRFPVWLGADGFTCLQILWIADRSAPPDLIAHEWRHTWQERRCGLVAFPLAYLIGFVLGGCTYRGNLLERDAYAFGAAHASEFTALAAAPSTWPT